MVRATFVLFCIATVAAPGMAAGQSATDTARRAQLIEQAQRADAANDHAHALELAEQAAAIAMSTSLRLFTAEQEMAVGHVADAMVNAEACVHEAEGNPALANRAVVLQECTRHMTELASRVGHLVVRPPARMPPGFTVSVGGATVDPTLYGVARPVAIGTVVLDAHADGRTPLHREIAVAAGATVEIIVELPRTVMNDQASASETPAAPSSPPPTSESGPSMMPYAVVGIGAVALIVSLASDVVRGGALSRLDTQCTPDATGHEYCSDTPQNRSDYGTAQTFDTVASVALAIGIVAVVGGTAWWLLDRRGGAHHDVSHAGLAPIPGGGGMLSVTGEF